MRVNSLRPGLAVEIVGLDLTGLDDRQFDDIQQLFLGNPLLVFRGQNLPAAEQVKFSRRFGELEVHVLTQYNHPEFPEVFVLSNVIKDGKPIGIADGGSYWHSDFAFRERPALVTILNAIQIPREGGQTIFVNMYEAYETLSPDWKKRIAGLQAVHRYRSRTTNAEQGTRVQFTDSQRAATPDVIHPIVRTHPGTGRKALFVHPGMAAEVVGMDKQESAEILDHLFKHATQPQLQYAFSWAPGDVVLWDNRCTMHKATTRDLAPHLHRTIHRTTVRGERPI